MKSFLPNGSAAAVLFVFALVFGMHFAIDVRAQKTEEPAASGFMSITTVTVKPDAVPEFEKMIITEYNAAFKKGGGTESAVWRVAVGNIFDYVFVQPMDNFAEMDGPSSLIKGLSPDAMESFFSRLTKMVTAVHSTIVRARPDLSHSTDMKSAPNVAVVVYVTVYPLKNAALENFVTKEYLPIVKKAGLEGFWVSQTVFGGNAEEYVMVELQKNFAEIDKGSPVKRVLKPDEAAMLFTKMGDGVVKNVEIIIARYNPEMSIVPAATK